MNHDTLAAPAEHLLEVKHSRFLARAAPVDSPSAAADWLETIRVADATHNCWAWRVGSAYRSSDDGEPAGTAGRPILAAIDGQGLDDVVVVVTRWYGGIKLGAGGLVRAYGGAAAQCLRTAPRRPLITYATLALAVQFQDLGTVHAALAAVDAVKCEERFSADGAELHVRLPLAHVQALRRQLRDATRGRARVLTDD